MNEIPRLAVAHMLLRSFAIQGSWNYRTLIGCGFAFALLPVLRVLYSERPDEYRAAVQRHTAVFNSHPYLAPMALGAVARLEGSEPAVVVDRFKSAVRGSLGGLGDRLIWAGFRPVCILLALVAMLMGVGWALVTGGFLLLYNTGHIGVRIWALRFGLRHGLHVGEKIRSAGLDRIQELFQHAGAFLIGICALLIAAGRPLMDDVPWYWLLAALLAALIGALLGARVRLPLVLALALVALLAIIGGALS